MDILNIYIRKDKNMCVLDRCGLFSICRRVNIMLTITFVGDSTAGCMAHFNSVYVVGRSSTF